MIPNDADFLIKRFEQPDEVRTFTKGKFEIVKIGSMTIGRASYEPGWKWSEHVGPAMGATSCERRARRPRHLRISRLPDERRPLLRNESRRSFLHRARARQLGRRR